MVKENQEKDSSTKEMKEAKELEETGRKFLRLYERFATEMLTISKQGEALGRIIEELKAESSLATEFKIQVRKGIMESVKKLTEEIEAKVENQIKKTIQESVTKELNQSTKEFKEVIEVSTEILRDYAIDRKVRNIWIYFGVFFCGFIFLFTAYTAGVLKRHMPESFLSSEQVSIYRSGLVCEKMWNRISKKEQDRILSIAHGSAPPEENSYEWIKRKHPKMDHKEIKKRFEELTN